MAKTRYIKTEKTGGGTDAMDGIDGALLLDQDFCWVCSDNFVDHYLLVAADGGAANPPTRIPPAVNPGTKMWIFQNLRSDGFVSVSTTSLAVGLGSKSLTVETNKGFVVGMSVKIAYTTTPTTWMHGDVTAYTPATGALVVNVGNISGTGTQAAWTVSMSSPILNNYASSAEIVTGTEAVKFIAPDQLRASEATAAEIIAGTVLKLITADQLKLSGLLRGGAVSLSDSSGTVTFDCNAGSGFYVTLSGTGRTLAISNLQEGQVYRGLLIQGSGGSKTITTWPTITWLGGGTAPVLSTTAGAADSVTFWYVNGVLYGSFLEA